MINKARLYAKATLYTMGKSKEARLLLNDYKGYLRFSVFVRDMGKPNSKAKLVANIPIRRDTIYILISELRKLDEVKEDNHTFAIETFSPIWENNQPTADKKPNGKIVIGKRKMEETGDIIKYIAILPPNSKEKYIFKFLPTPYVKFYKNNKPLSDTEASKLWAEGWAKNIEAILDLYPDVIDDAKEATIKALDENTKPVIQNAKKEKDENVDIDVEDLF